MNEPEREPKEPDQPPERPPEVIPYLDLSALGEYRGVVLVDDQVDVVSEPPAAPAQPPIPPDQQAPQSAPDSRSGG